MSSIYANNNHNINYNDHFNDNEYNDSEEKIKKKDADMSGIVLIRSILLTGTPVVPKVPSQTSE